MENPINILVVEDDTNINNLLKTALEKAGYQVIQAFSGTEAELVLQMQKSVSLVLLDLMLPGISGEEVLKSIRKKGNLPVIILTAKDSLDEKIGLLTQGADDYITKPFELPASGTMRRPGRAEALHGHHPGTDPQSERNAGRAVSLYQAEKRQFPSGTEALLHQSGPEADNFFLL